MIHHSRTPAGLVLLLTTLAAIGLVMTAGDRAQATDDAALLELERAVADPNASLDTWFAYARQLHHRNRLDFAAMAYQRVLETDPYHREANLYGGIALAQAQQPDALHEFLRRLILHDPRLAVELIGRPELHAYLREARFQTLAREARFQAMD